MRKKYFAVAMALVLMCSTVKATAGETMKDAAGPAGETMMDAAVDTAGSVQSDEQKPNYWKQLIAPAALIAAGGICAIDYDHGINKEVNDWMASETHHNDADDYLRFVPSAGYLALGYLGVKAKHNGTERLLVFATSHAAMLALGYGLKAAVSEWRPNHKDEDAMPSGHAVLSFTGAELIREEYGNYWGLGGYAVATATAVLRLHNNAHWLGDVLMGAGLGVLSARIGYWMLPVERKWLGMSKEANIVAVPTYDGRTHALGLGFAAVF